MKQLDDNVYISPLGGINISKFYVDRVFIPP